MNDVYCSFGKGVRSEWNAANPYPQTLPVTTKGGIATPQNKGACDDSFDKKSIGSAGLPDHQ